ncbi:hypothetical protein B0H17DRAFT_1207230 [Mycena rosella]|uniref:Uncharacterized protein n=1 Tax=Mycena rosella TaxID=1033263 RepID=A0AAD7D3G3_MYCRO|nr:hypothetical protein B0H17DRAFT_1207230 [Mycena rosella]
MTYHTTVPGTAAVSGAKTKTKPKQKKETKTKEFTHNFEPMEENYLTLLKTILLKHGEEKYNITKKMTYGIKVQLPEVNKGNSLDIDNFTEYEDLANDIVVNLPSKMNIYVDMQDIQKWWSGRGSGSDNEDVNGDDTSLYDANGLSDTERELARLRGKLEKQWQNDHDAGYTYIDPKTGFDPAKRQVALHPTRIATGANKPRGSATESNGVGEVIGHLATMITAIVGGGARTVQLPITPQKNPPASAPIISPVIPSPTKLPRFLEHCEKNLGISGARGYEFGIRLNGYGPDIMHLVDDKELADLGINKGDAICIKAGSQTWWNGPNAKRKRGDDSETMPGSSGANLPDINATPPAKKVAFKRCFTEGRSERLYGPRLAPGDGERNVFYHCPRRNKFVPIPRGYCSTIEDEYVPGADDDDWEEVYLWQLGDNTIREEEAAQVLANLH